MQDFFHPQYVPGHLGTSPGRCGVQRQRQRLVPLAAVGLPLWGGNGGERFTHRRTRFHTQTLLHTDAFTHRRFYTQTLLHADAFYTRTHAFTHKRFYTQTLLHTDTFTQTKASIAIFPPFLTSSVHFVRKGCAGHFKVAIFPHFLTSNVHFVRKGCARRIKVAIFPQFLTSNVHFVRKGCAGHLKVAIFPQFLKSNVHFVRKGCVSWRSGGTAPALREKIEEEREEICRCEGVKI